MAGANEEQRVDRALSWLEGRLRAARESGSGWRRWWRRGRMAVIAMSVCYVVALVAGLIVMSWIGERFWVFSLLLYLPPAIWLLPLVALFPPGLVFCRRICWLHLIAVGFVLAVFLPFHWSLPKEAEEDSFTIVSNNMGQRRTRTLFPLIEEVRPDILALQDSSLRRGQALMLGATDLEAAHAGPFVVVSRFPILSSKVVEGLEYWGEPLAARFEIDIGGETVVLYNIRLPTPRPDFHRLRGRGILSGEIREDYRNSLRERIRLSEAVAEMLAKEERPFMAVGDLNAPSQGYVRRRFAEQATDLFVEAGRGYGLTFPGVSRNPLSLFGPWLRLDCLFASDEFRALDCWVEPRQEAQHRAVIARVALRNG